MSLLDPALPEVDMAALADAALPRLDEEPALPETPAILDELLIEEVSIDGMCGVY
jgi:mycofactocin precursor